MNQMKAQVLPLGEIMKQAEGWGRSQGRAVYHLLLKFVEDNPGSVVFRISLQGVKRMDISFASETIVELARRFRRSKGFYLVNLTDTDMVENIDAACVKKNLPILIVGKEQTSLIGLKPSEGTREAYEFAMNRSYVRASELAKERGISLQNASMKLKKLWDQGFLLRQEIASDSGGVEFEYSKIQ